MKKLRQIGLIREDGAGHFLTLSLTDADLDFIYLFIYIAPAIGRI